MRSPTRRVPCRCLALAATAFAFAVPGAAARAQEGQPPTVPPVTSSPASQVAEPQQGSPGAAGDPAPIPAGDPSQLEKDLAELARQVDVLAEEVERLRSGEEEEAALTDEQRRALGLAPSAAATYRKKRGVSLAGYGEMLLEDPAATNQSGASGSSGARLDLLRLVVYTGYRFSDRVLFNSEIEIEHANEISVELAYIDYLFNTQLGVRGGMVLVPLGLVNEFHEPTVFLGARRSETETRIIPSTWRETGFGGHGSFGPLSYRAYVVSGLYAAGFTSQGLRGGRQKGSRTRFDDPAFAGRVDVTPLAGLSLGAGVFAGGADQDAVMVAGRKIAVSSVVTEAHGQWQVRGLDLRGLYARATVSHAGLLSKALGLPADKPVAEEMLGGYGQIGYNVLSQVTDKLWLVPYYRYERVDTQYQVPQGFAADPTQDGIFHTYGVEFRPLYSVVIKVDYQRVSNRSETGRNQFNLNLGYAF